MLLYFADCPYVTRFVGCGRQDDFNFLVMELLGKSVSDLRRKKNDHLFSYSTTALLSHQMLDAIEAVHNHGYLHRDIKPVRYFNANTMFHTDPFLEIVKFCTGNKESYGSQSWISSQVFYY